MSTGHKSGSQIEKVADSSCFCQLCLLPAEYRVTLSIPKLGTPGRGMLEHSRNVPVLLYCGYHFILEATDNPIIREALMSSAPGLCGFSDSTDYSPIPKSGAEDLITQLEESKFMRFFREFGCDDVEPEEITVPLDLPDAEVFLTTHENHNACVATSMFKQVAHLPANLWQRDFARLFLEKSLRHAFRNLRRREDLIEALDGSRSVRRAYELFGNEEEQFPETYGLFTNLPEDLIDHGEFSQLAGDLCHRMLNIPRAVCPTFHLVTPEGYTHGSEAARVKKFLIELLNTPSGYYFVAREGHISIVPATEHGTFFASGVKGPTDDLALSAAITSTLPKPEVLLEIEALANLANTKERDFQDFFESHPELLFGLDERYCELRPHVCLIDAKKERLIPDFMMRLNGSSLWDVVELKMPQHRLTVRHGGMEKPSAQAARAIAELLAYRDFFAIRSNRQRIEDRFGIAPYEPCLVLVIGRGRSKDRYEWESIRPGFPKIQIVSYDYLFERARQARTALDHTARRV